MAMLTEFKEFAVKGNVVDMAVGIIIGASFGTIARSLVDDIIMPPIGLVLGGVRFENIFAVIRQGDPVGPYITIADARAAGAITMNFGVFINTVLTFLIVAFSVFLLVRAINRLRREEQVAPRAPTDRPCPFCTSTISIMAVRCPNCTSQLEPVVPT